MARGYGQQPSALRPWLAVAFAAALVTAVLVLEVPSRIAALGSGNLDRLVAPTTTTSFGRTVELGGRADLEVSADRPTPVRVLTRRVRAGHDHRFVAIELVIRNTGTQPWVSTDGLAVEVVDRTGKSYGADARVLKARGGKVLEGVTRLRPGLTIRRLVVFAVPRNATISGARFTVGSGLTQTAEWRLERG